MRVQVVSPWYPDYASVFLGKFVAQQVAALRDLGVDVAVEVPQLFPAPSGPVPAEVVEALTSLAVSDPASVYPQEDGTCWIPSLVPSRSGYIGRVHAFEEALRRKRAVLPVAADVTHAHLGVPTAAALLGVGDGPLVVTEHQSTLDLVLAEPRARDAYREVLERSDRFFVVSPHLCTTIVDHVGEAAREHISVLPNIVDLSDLPFAARPVAGRSWLYVGGLHAHKGVKLLVQSFIAYRATFEPEAQLCLVGDGPLKAWVLDEARQHGASDAVQLAGAVAHRDLAGYFADADVFVHLSPAETFGIAALEAIGSGLPVVSLRHGGAEHAWGDIVDLAGRLLAPNASAREVAAAVDGLRNSSRLDAGAARRFVEDRYAPQRIAEQLLDAYRDVVRSGAPS